MDYFTMNLQPMRHMHQYIPSVMIKGAGLKGDSQSAYRFAQQMFIAGADWQQDVISMVFTDKQEEIDWKYMNNVALCDALRTATEQWDIKPDSNARTFGQACFKGGKRYCLDTFAALHEDVMNLPF